MENIYKTHLVYLNKTFLNDKKNIDTDMIGNLDKFEIIVEKGNEGFYWEITSGKSFQMIDTNSLRPSYEEGPYIIKPNEINDRLDNSIYGYNKIKDYIKDANAIKEFINNFIEMEKNQNEEDHLHNLNYAKYMEEESKKLVLKHGK